MGVNMAEFKGSCLCGSVRYQITGEATAFYHCHCQRCRKTFGGSHASNIRIAAQEIEWLSGESLIKSHKVKDADRFRNDFCGECGSPLPRYFSETNFIVLPAGTLDHEPEIKPQARIFYASRSGWSCQDGLPEFEKYPE